MEIPVNVGDDGHSHDRRTLAKRAGLIALAAVWVVSGFLLWRTSVPRLDIPHLDPRDYFSPAELARADDYRRVSRALLLGSLAVQVVVMALLVWKARPLADALGGIGRGRIRTGVLVSIAVVIALWLATMPIGAVSLWWRRRYGLSNQSAAGWLRDQAVAVGIECLLVAVAATVTLVLAAWLGRSWWVAAAPLFVLAGVVYFVAQPLVIQPLFNTFHPLADQRLTAEIKELGAKEGVTVDKVLVADASRRTTTANAYVSGLGPTKRVVFYDTMLDGRFTPAELESVAAHELGHVARSHIWRGLGWFALIAIPGVLLVWWFTERRGGLPDPGLVPLAIAVALVYSLLVMPFGNLVSRRYEAEADWLALTATNNPESFIGVEKRLTVTSLGDPDPPAWSNLLFGTHPTPMRRIGMAVAFRNRASPARAGS
ncbi:MAG TPA: M48 family metallopeptidase [Gaiellaceae bacterium]|nr:M48 family metallopeptidase [Gaiellaceae bacterium]